MQSAINPGMHKNLCVPFAYFDGSWFLQGNLVFVHKERKEKQQQINE